MATLALSISKSFAFHTVFSVYINTMKTTFDYNFDFYQGFKQYGYKL